MLEVTHIVSGLRAVQNTDLPDSKAHALKSGLPWLPDGREFGGIGEKGEGIKKYK